MGQTDALTCLTFCRHDLAVRLGGTDLLVKVLVSGNLGGLQMMLQGGTSRPDMIRLAAARGHLEVVRWLHDNRTEGCTTDAMNWAAKNGHLEVVRWLHEDRSEGCTKRAMNDADGYGHLEVVRWLHEHRSEGCTTDAMVLAARHGHLEVVKWLHENRKVKILFSV